MKRLLILLIALSLLGVVSAQTISWAVYDTTNSGLPHNCITSTAIDGNGSLWVGTYDGLARFDGATWTTYTASHLQYRDITSIAVDDSGIVWLSAWSRSSAMGFEGHGTGLTRFDGNTWTIYHTGNSGLPNDDAIPIAIDASGAIWIGTVNGLAKFEDTTWTVYDTTNSGIPDNIITSIAIDGNGNKWIGTSDGLVKFNDTIWTVYNTSNSGLPIDDVRRISIDANGYTKWIGAEWNSLAMFDDTSWTVYDTSNLVILGAMLSSIAIEGNGDVWVGTGSIDGWGLAHGLGVARFDGSSWTVFDPTNSGLPHYGTFTITTDMSGNKWIGTYDGLAVYNENGIQSVDDRDIPKETNRVYPNPSSGKFTFEFKVSTSGIVIIEIYNSNGMLSDKIHKDPLAGSLRVTWDPKDLPNGIYYYRLLAGNRRASGKLILMR